MEKWLLVAESNCTDPSREKEFDQWYDNVHVPDTLETPGFIRATRYEASNQAEGRGRFLALYEVETEDIGQTMASLGENVTEKWQQGRMSELIELISTVFYRQIAATVESK